MKKIILSLMLLFGMSFISPHANATVSSTINKVIYNGDNITSTFTFTFNVYKSTDLVLTEVNVTTGIETELTLNIDYTVALSKAAPTPGTITLTAGALATGTELVIQRILPFTQQINISDYSPTPAATWNEGYDRGVMLSQQLQEQVGRAIVQSITQSNQITFPTPVDGECIGWSGTDLINMACSGGGGGGGSNFNPPIADSQLQSITTSNKVNGSALYSLSSIPSGAGSIPLANIPTLSDSKLSQITTASKVSGTAITGLAIVPVGAGALSVVNGGTGQTTQQAAIDVLTAVSSATNEYVLTKDTATGHAIFKTTSSSQPVYYADSTTVIASAIAEETTNSIPYTKVKEITFYGSGTLYFSAQIKTANASYACYFKIYRNGSPVGTEQTSNSTDYVTVNDTVSGWSNGDKIQVYIHAPTSVTVYVKNFQILGTQSTINID